LRIDGLAEATGIVDLNNSFASRKSARRWRGHGEECASGVAALDRWLISATLPGSNRESDSGGVAALDRRLISATLPGSNRESDSGGVATLNRRLISATPAGVESQIGWTSGLNARHLSFLCWKISRPDCPGS
jgi:hypothetical protein